MRRRESDCIAIAASLPHSLQPGSSTRRSLPFFLPSSRSIPSYLLTVPSLFPLSCLPRGLFPLSSLLTVPCLYPLSCLPHGPSPSFGPSLPLLPSFPPYLPLSLLPPSPPTYLPPFPPFLFPPSFPPYEGGPELRLLLFCNPGVVYRPRPLSPPNL